MKSGTNDISININKSKTKYLGYLYLAFFFISSSLSAIFIKYLYIDKFNVYQVFGYPVLIGSIWVITFYRKRTPPLPKLNKVIVYTIIVALCGFLLLDVFYKLALQQLPLSQVTIIYNTYPALYFFASIFFLKSNSEKLNINVIFGILLCIIGTYMIIQERNTNEVAYDLKGFLYIFIAVVLTLVYMILCKKYLINESDYLICAHLIAGIAAIIILTYTSSWVLPEPKQLIYLCFIGIVYNCLGSVFYIKALKILSSAKMTFSLFFLPASTNILAIIMLGEKMSIILFFGFSIILFGNIISCYKYSPHFLKKNNSVSL